MVRGAHLLFCGLAQHGQLHLQGVAFQQTCHGQGKAGHVYEKRHNAISPASAVACGFLAGTSTNTSPTSPTFAPAISPVAMRPQNVFTIGFWERLIELPMLIAIYPAYTYWGPQRSFDFQVCYRRLHANVLPGRMRKCWK